MARCRCISQRDLATPFLVEDGGAGRYKRTIAIQDQVTAYLASIDAARPYVQAGALDKAPAILSRPPILVLAERIGKWGFPYPGTWTQQPKDLILDLEAAQTAREIYKNKPKSKSSASVSRGGDPFADAPSFESIKVM